MSVGTNLLELQAIDLDLVRERTELSQMPELKTLAQKRKTYAKLKDELLKLVGRRKDLETEVNELNEDEKLVVSRTKIKPENELLLVPKANL